MQKGDGVALISMARNEFLITFMAASKIGAMWLGLSPKSTVEEVGYMLREYRRRDKNMGERGR